MLRAPTGAGQSVFAAGQLWDMCENIQVPGERVHWVLFFIAVSFHINPGFHDLLKWIKVS
jgi:hypothetical protein